MTGRRIGDPITPEVLDENDRTGRSLALSPDMAARLAATKLVWANPEPGHADGQTWFQLVPRPGMVGAVRCLGLAPHPSPSAAGPTQPGECDVIVHAKARFSSILFMLAYAADPGFRPNYVHGDEDDDIWPTVAQTFAMLTERALTHGLLRGYTDRDDALPYMRGRLRASDQVRRHFTIPLPLEVHYREYTPNTPENRILRTALGRLLRVPHLGPGLTRRLRRLGGQLAAAVPLHSGEPIPRWQPTRLNRAYQPALRLAELVLRHLGLTLKQGGERVASFVVYMPKVFEDFVGTAIREALHGAPGEISTQHSEPFDEDGTAKVRPDVALVRGGKVAAVWDAKYKLSRDQDHGTSPDLYQMLAYCVRFGLTDGHLVYVDDGVDSDGTGSISHADYLRVCDSVCDAKPEIRIHLHRLDVKQEPDRLLAQMKDIAQAATT
ncbi:MAG: McrC family protein [Bifidobacteriaceae bacterium]|jgi:5-methylcytosine-specific restriction enzyme subunit McrC|nr:McrC family protein [Bifidobacteriaceae bacterium]